MALVDYSPEKAGGGGPTPSRCFQPDVVFANDTYELNAGNRRTAGEFIQKRIADIAQVFDSDLASEVAVHCQIAQKSKETDAGSEAGVLGGVRSISNEV